MLLMLLRYVPSIFIDFEKIIIKLDIDPMINYNQFNAPPFFLEWS
jgi:hypothetical protein